MPVGTLRTVDVVEETRAGPVLRVHVTPRARVDAVVGADARGLLVRVRAAPEKGKANDEVVRTIAKWLGVRRSLIELIAGGSARDKRLRIELDAAALRAMIDERLS